MSQTKPTQARFNLSQSSASQSAFACPRVRMADLFQSVAGLLTAAFSYSTAAFYGVCFLYRLVRRWLKDPSDPFWKVKERELPPECMNDPALGNHAYVQIKNVKLHYVHKGDPSNPLMLCVHGFPEFWFSWRYQLKEFSNDYWVVAVDMRGYGDSEKPVGRKYYAIEHLMGDLKNLIFALGKEKCTLLGHDWGGIVSWFLVLMEPQLVDKYCIMNSAHPTAFRKVVNKGGSQFKKSWYAFFFQLPYLPELSCRMDDMDFLIKAYTAGNPKTPMTEEEQEAYKFTFGKPGALTYPINYYRANFMLKTRSLLKNKGKSPDFPPGLVLFGDKDAFIDREVQEETIKLVANSRLVYVNATHFLQQDDPEAVNKELWKFFTEVKSSGK